MGKLIQRLVELGKISEENEQLADEAARQFAINLFGGARTDEGKS